MAYTVTHTNGQNPIVIPDGTLDTSTSVILVGKNYPNYGAILDQNFIRLLENSANSSAPSAPTVGELWYKSDDRVLKVYIGGNVWKNVGSTTSSSTKPSNSNVGDLWWDTLNGQLLAFDNTINDYKLIGPIGTSAGIDTTPIIDNLGGSHDVISFVFGQDKYLILSNSAAFTPQTPINGFATVKPGLNLASTSFLHSAQFAGQASDAATVGGVSATQFLRADQNSGTSGTLSVLNNNGLYVGTANTFHVATSGGNAAVINETNSGFMNFKVRNSSGTQLDAMDIYPNGNVVANFDFTVMGNISFANSANDLVITGLSPSYNYATGALRLSTGGMGIAGNINTGGSNNNFVGQVRAASIVSNSSITGATIGNSGAVLYGTLNSSSAAQPNITSVGTLNSLTVTGLSTLSGGIAGTINTAAQPNITSLGTLTGLTSSGIVSFSSASSVALGSVSNVKITGGTNGQYLVTDGSGNLSWSALNISGATNGVAYFGAGSALTGTNQFTWNGSTLYVNGALEVTGDITAFYSSDARLKTNIQPITGALDKVGAINGVTYNWNTLSNKSLDVTEVGVIAQEVQAVLPEVVVERDNGYLAVNYEKIVPLLIEAIKELRAEVDSLRTR
jgi:hypothetical protein